MSRRKQVIQDEDEDDVGQEAMQLDNRDVAGSGSEDSGSDDGLDNSEDSSSELTSDFGDGEEEEEDEDEDEAEGRAFDEHEGSAEPEDFSLPTAPAIAPVKAIKIATNKAPAAVGAKAATAPSTSGLPLPLPVTKAKPIARRISVKSSRAPSSSRDQTPLQSPRIRRIRIIGDLSRANSAGTASGSVTPVPRAKSTSTLARAKGKKRVIEDEQENDNEEEDMEEDDEDNLDDEEMDDLEGTALPSSQGSLSPLGEDVLEYSDDDDFSTSNELPDPTKLTARQRAARLGGTEDPLLSIMDADQKPNFMTKNEKRFANLTSEEAALKRNESTRRRKNLADQKLEEEKVETIKRLLNKTVSKSKSNGLEEDEGGSGAIKGGSGKKRFLKHDGENGRPGIKFKWIDDKEKTRLTIPQTALELVQSICAQRAYPTRSRCSAAGCTNFMIYRSRQGQMACSMEHLKGMQGS